MKVCEYILESVTVNIRFLILIELRLVKKAIDFYLINTFNLIQIHRSCFLHHYSNIILKI